MAAAAGSAVSADIIEQILVKVNGEIITKTDLEQRQVAAIRQRPEAQAMRGDDAAVAKLLTEVTPQVIVDAVDELLLIQRGKELGYTMGDEQFNSIVENIRKENKIESEEQFQAALKQEGMTMLDLRRQLEKQMLVNRVQQTEVAGKIGVTDDEVKAYYEANKASFATSPNVTLREILVAVPATEAGVNVAADEEAAAKAADIERAPEVRRALRAAGRRSVRRPVQGQRRAARRDPVQRDRARAAEGNRRAAAGPEHRRRGARRAATRS